MFQQLGFELSFDFCPILKPAGKTRMETTGANYNKLLLCASLILSEINQAFHGREQFISAALAVYLNVFN